MVQDRGRGTEGLKDQGNLSRPLRKSAVAPGTGPKPPRSSPCCRNTSDGLHFHSGVEKHIIKKQGKKDTAHALGKTVGSFLLNQ